MTIENSIDKLAAAITELAQALQASRAEPAPAPEAVQPPAAAPEAEPEEAPAEEPAPAPEVEAEPVSEEVQEPPLTLAEAGRAIKELMTAGRVTVESVKAAMAEVGGGASRLSQIDPSLFRAVIVRLEGK